jgi:hypothetical protein
LVGEYISGTENHIFEYDLARKGIKRPVFNISVDGELKERLYLNISRKPSDLFRLDTSLYNEFIQNGSELVIPYSNGWSFNIRVPKIEHVLATKISHFRAKDAMDLQNLYGVLYDSNEEIDFKELERILLPVYEVNLERFKSLVGIAD